MTRRRRFLLTAVAAAASLYGLLALTPYPELARFRERGYGLVLTDRDGVVLRVFTAPDGVKREWTPLEGIPRNTVRIFLRAEDRFFYLHPGVDPLAAARSLLANIRAGRVVSGASTVTMQLARMIRPRTRGLRGKAAEALDALRLEARLSKRDILELWFNGLPFGSNIEGLAAVSRARFGLPPERLDEGQALLLAVIPRRPALYDPARNPEAAARAAWLLSRRCGFAFTLEELQRKAASAASVPAPFRAPHFTDRLAASIPPGSRLPVTTSLSLKAQTLAEGLLRGELAALSGSRVTNGAVLAIDNDTGEALAYVGSASWFDDEAGGKIDGVRSLGQAGSCLKPFLYALALDNGFTPASILPDLPSVFGEGEAYAPGNFNNRFNGPVRLRVALASSLNVPAVYLLDKLGPEAFENCLASLGFDSIAASKETHGNALALGAAEVSLEELVRAFSAFPRGGSAAARLDTVIPGGVAPRTPHWGRCPQTPTGGPRAPQAPLNGIYLGGLAPQVNPIKGGSGGPSAPRRGGGGAAPPQWEVRAAPPVSLYAAWAVADILADMRSRFTGFGVSASLPFPAMVKTGTANQYQRILALAASGRFTVGVWMGNFSGATVRGETGSAAPARAATRLLAALEEAAGPAPPGKTLLSGIPPGSAEAEICALSGMARAPACPGFVRERFQSAACVPAQCTWHRGGGAGGGGGGGAVYPPEYSPYLAERSRRAAAESAGPGVIRLPRPGAVFYAPPAGSPEPQAMRVEAAGFTPGAALYLDGALLGFLVAGGLYALPVPPVKGAHLLEVDDDVSSASVEFTVR